MDQEVVNHEVETRVQAWEWPDAEGSEALRSVEPRFQLYPPAKVILLDDPEAELDCVLTDISLTDIKILAGESLPEDEIIAIELEDSLLLASVRYNLRRRDKFSIGAARMHTLQKFAAPPNATKIEMLETLIGDFHAQCASQIEKIQDAIQSLQIPPRKESTRREPPALALTVPVEAAGFSQGKSPRSEPDIVREQLPVNEQFRVNEPSRVNIAEPFEVVYSKAASKAPREEADAALPGFVANGSGGRKSWVKSIASASGLAAIGLATLLAWWIPITATVFHSRAPRNTSRLVSSPQATSQSSPPAPVPVPVAENRPAVTRMPEPADRLISPAAAPVMRPAIPAIASAPIRALPVPRPETPVSPDLRHALIKASQNSWIDVCSDGREVLQKLLAPGEIQEFDFARRAMVRMGNARGVEIAVNGIAIEPLGRVAVVGAVELSAEGSRYMSTNDGINLSGCGSRQPARHVAVTRPEQPEDPRPAAQIELPAQIARPAQVEQPARIEPIQPAQ